MFVETESTALGNTQDPGYNLGIIIPIFPELQMGEDSTGGCSYNGTDFWFGGTCPSGVLLVLEARQVSREVGGCSRG